MADWSLEHELCKLSGTSEFGEALAQLGLLSRGETGWSLQTDSDWHRGGAETYLYRFWVRHHGDTVSGFLLKACVGFALVGTVEDILEQWMSRRRLISAHGLSTPTLITYGYGVVLEEIVPFQLRTLVASPGASQMRLLAGLAQWAAVLGQLGFAPLNLFEDLYSHGEDVVLVDFGQDLGPPGIAEPTNHLFEQMMAALDSWNVVLPVGAVNCLRDTFLSFCKTSKGTIQ